MEQVNLITYKSCSSDSELQQILSLQQKNLPSALTEEEKSKEGFVTVVHTFEILKKMNEACPHIIAMANDKVIAYALSMHPKFGNQIEVLVPMFNEIEKLELTDFIAMGQICIDKQFRRKGVFRQLYQTMKTTVFPEFSSIVTEVDAENKRSLAAHQAIGFTDLTGYWSGSTFWKIIQLK